MSCNNYNSNGAPQVVMSGSVPSNSCFTTVPDLFTLFKNSLVGSLPTDFSTFLISDTEPAPSNRDKAWIYVDSTTCRPIGLRLYLNGAWVDVGARYFYGTDTSSVVNTITVASTTPSVNWSETGQLFAIKIAQANTGPVTISITNGTTTFYSGVAIKQYGSSALSGLEMLAGHVALFYYDGTQFQLLNPRPSSGSGSSSSTSGGYNLSFEDDTDGNGVPDSWSVYARSGSATGVSFTGSGVDDSYSSPTGGSFSLDTVTTQHGSKSAKFTCASGAGNGGGCIQNAGWIPCDGNSIIEVSWWARTNATGIDCSAEILFYTDKSDASYIAASKVTLWTDTANGPNAVWYQLGGITKSPSTARYYKIRLIAGILNNDVSGSVWFDDVQLNAPRFNKKITFTDTTFNVTSGVASHIWIAPATTYQVKVTLVGGGASGHTSGGGGGAGEGVISYVTIAPSSQHTVGVPQLEKDASFDSTTVKAKAGTPASGSSGAAGGTGGTGNVTISGESGSNSPNGCGGSSILGAGGSANAGGSTNGNLYGGGGGGHATSLTRSGAQGVAIIEYN